VKVLLGWVDQIDGNVEVSACAGGLVYAGPEPEHLRGIVEGQRRWHHRKGELHILTDDELVRSLPYCLQGYL
jgi:hypothetical protein